MCWGWSNNDHVELSNPFSERLFYVTEKMNKTDGNYEQRIDELKSDYSEIEKTLVELSEATKFTKPVLSNYQLQSQDTVGISIEELDKFEALLIQLVHFIGNETCPM